MAAFLRLLSLRDLKTETVISDLVDIIHNEIKEEEILNMTFIDNILLLSKLVESFVPSGNRQEIRDDVLKSIISQICFPYIFSNYAREETSSKTNKSRKCRVSNEQNYTGGTEEYFREATHLVTKLLLSCTKLSQGCNQIVFDACMRGIKGHIKKLQHGDSFHRDLETVKEFKNLQGFDLKGNENGLPLYLCCQLLSQVEIDKGQKCNFTKDSQIEINVLDLLLKVIILDSNENILASVTSVLTSLIHGSKEAKLVWSKLLEMSKSMDSSHHSTAYGITCAMIDKFLPNETNQGPCAFDLRREMQFWKFIQQGMTHLDPLSRKRCMYVFKRILDTTSKERIEITVKEQDGICPLFWWNNKSSRVLWEKWKSFILLMESLEEKQNHVILPVLPTIEEIITAVSFEVAGEYPVLHCSWLSTILTRAFMHDSKIITRWAVKTFLSLDLDRIRVLAKENWDFIFSYVLNVLGDLYLYAKEEKAEIGDPPLVLECLERFVVNCARVLPKEDGVEFFRKILLAVCNRNFSDVPMVYITEALSGISLPGVMDMESLNTLRTFFQLGSTYYNSELRHSIYYFLIKYFLQCLDIGSITFFELISVFSVLVEQNILTYHSKLSKFIQDWFTKNLFFFKGSPCEITSSKTAVDWFLDHVALHTENYLDGNESSGVALNGDAFVLSIYYSLYALTETSEYSEQQHSSITFLEQQLLKMIPGVIDTVSRVNSNPYLNKGKVQRSFQLLFDFLKFLSDKVGYEGNTDELPRSHTEDRINEITFQLIFSHASSILQFTRTNFSTSISHIETDCRDLSDVCFNIQSVICETLIKSKHSELVLRHIQELSDICISALGHVTDKADNFYKCVTFKHLSWVCQIAPNLDYSDASATKVVNSLAAATGNVDMSVQYCKNRQEKANECLGDKKTSSVMNSCDLTPSLWSTIEFGLLHGEYLEKLKQGSELKVCPSRIESDLSDGKSKKSSLAECNLSDFVNLSLEAFDIVIGSDIIPLLKCVKLITPLIIDYSLDLTIRVLESIWRIFLAQNRRDSVFWSVLERTIDIIFHPVLILSSETEVHEKLTSFWKELFDIGSRKTGVANYVVNHFCQVWRDLLKDHHSAVLYSVQTFKNLVVECCLFGSLCRRNFLIIRETCEHLIKQGLIRSKATKDDRLVRIRMLEFLFQLDPSRTKDNTAVSNIIYEVIKESERCDNSKNYFLFSLAHRKNLRTWQAILFLLKFMVNSKPEALLQECYQGMVRDHQPSVRYLIEWTCILLLAKCVHLRDSIWIQLRQATEKRIASINAVVGVLIHLSALLFGEDFSHFVTVAIPNLLPWAQAQHIQARVFSQIALHSLWETVKGRNLTDLIDKFQLIESCFSLNEQNTAVVKHRTQLRNVPYYRQFHPLRHYSVESLFFNFFKMCDIPEEEHIPLDYFSHKAFKSEEHDKFCIKIYDEPPLLCSENATTISGSLSKPEDNDTSQSPKVNSSKDVQKKITPLNVLPPTEDTFLQTTHMYKRQSQRHDLIVCASLIDKTPNLGGLCRTCEIFGASKLTIGSYRYLDDSQFKSLSVSSERWMNVEQIMPRYLEKYLKEMKKEGYTLVGVEQTANSKKLHEYQFHNKTLLLLGNEKEGIPVELIQLLDDCVEIPQQGIIRSLNVHVSGAIMIWEYCRQKMPKE